ncbi:polyketide synthase [Apiospora sp. TS-2023a]
MSASREHWLVLFGGQGSPSIFSPHTAATAEDAVAAVSSCSILLSSCHAAFLADIASLDAQSQHLLGIDVSCFRSTHDLLKPKVQYHTHPVVQATTIYLCQFLHYISETQREGTSYEETFDKLREINGLCSGLIPATVVARSRSLDDLVASGVQGFRLAFWVACRTHLYTLRLNQRHHVDDYDGEDTNSEATLSLVTRGLSRDQVEEKLSQHYAKHTSEQESQQTPRRMQISATTQSGAVSISGPKADLCAFKAQALADLTATFAHVHGWYHGGDQLEGVVQEVIEDTRRRAISFRSCSAGAKAIRSTLDGTLFDMSNTASEEVVAWLSQHLLIHCVNWSDTAEQIATSVMSLLEQEPEAAVKVLSFGPASSSLFPDLQPLDSRVALLDMSPFKMGGGNNPALSGEQQDGVAIVGMSVNLPKGQGVEMLWDTLSQGLDVVQEIPNTRFQVSDYNLEDQHKPRSMHIKHGAFLEYPFTFDNAYFNISPREAKSMDPQQRVLLHAAQEALEDAGYVADSSPSFQRASTGCYIGLATGDYTDNLRDDIDVFYSAGTLRAFHSGRISYFYKLSGPSIVTDTACSSSMVSIYQACRALQNGDCTSAIAGGVNVITSPDMYLGLARGHFLSPTGGCKPFDANADGYCRAEGCVLFVLKRLSDAVAEGDRIHGVIRNVLVNQSGNSHSITHPHSPTQTDLLNRLLQQANVDPRSVGVVEAHGTGTQAGDGREVNSIKSVFGPHVSTTNPLVVSSIKGNIGHCEAASGAAGLAKLLLMLRERTIPVQAGLKNINPSFAELESSGFVFPRRTIPWKHSQRTPRRAVLNNFGAAGSNASLLLEDWVESPKSQQHRNPQRSAYVFSLSAKSEKTLRSAVDRHIGFLKKASRLPPLADICYTATARRQIHDHRISLACTSVDDLLTQLHRYKAIDSRPAQKVPATVFVFSGQGALYRGMGQELMSTYHPFRDIILSCDRIIQGLACPSIIPILTNEQVTWNEVEEIIAWQCACVALEYALAKMFMSWGVIPDYVMGHSIGEYAALCISGALTLEDTFRVVASRAKLMSDHCLANTSGMLACNISQEKAEQMIAQDPSLAQLSIACQNSSGDCVVGGPLRELAMLQDHCKSRKPTVRTKLLDVPYAFHTSAMDPILEPLRAIGRSVKSVRPTIPVISNVHGRFFTESDFTGDYFALHARNAVRFSDGLRSLQETGLLDGAMILEMGPQPALLPMLRTSLSSGPSTSYLGTLQKGQDAWKSISETLAAIFLRKTTYAIQWREVFAGTSARVTSLPGHLLEGSTFRIPYRESRSVAAQIPPEQSSSSKPELGLGLGLSSAYRKTEFHLLPWVNERASSNQALVLETDMGVLGPWISGHDVGGTPICPASVFHELALEATQTMLAPPKTQVLVVNGMTFASPLVYSPSQENMTVMVTVRVTGNNTASPSAVDFTVTSRSVEDFVETMHCSGSVSVQDLRVNAPCWVRDEAMVTRQSRLFSGIGKDYMSTFRTKVLYEAIFTRVVKYSPEYQSLVYLHSAESNLEGLGSFAIPSGSSSSPRGCLTHPVFTDTLLHAAGFLANLAIGSTEIGICAGVEAIEIAYHDVDYSETFQIYCSLLEIKGAILADAIALNSAGKVVAVARGMEFKRLRLSAFQQALSRRSTTTPPIEPPPRLREQPVAATKMYLPPTGLETPPTSTSGDGMSSPTTKPHTDTSPFGEGISQTLKSIVMEVGGFAEQDIDYTKSLDELGIDSLMQIELVSKLARTFPGQAGRLNHHVLSECETLEALEDLLSSILQGTSAAVGLGNTSLIEVPRRVASSPVPAPGYNRPLADTSPVPNTPAILNSATGSEAPLCLFHDGSGQISMYARLRGHDRTTYAFFDPYFGSDKRPHRSINAMAEDYASSLLSNTTTRSPLILAGWSFGGVVAFEAARQLAARGIEVKGLVLIDSPSPVDHEPLPAAIIANIIKSSGQPGNAPQGKYAALEEEFRCNADLLGIYKPEPFPKAANGRGLKTVMLRSQDVFDPEALCGVRYDWLGRQDTRTAAIATWQDLVGSSVHVMPIPGHHFEPFTDENIDETGAQLWRACRFIENSSENDYSFAL